MMQLYHCQEEEKWSISEVNVKLLERAKKTNLSLVYEMLAHPTETVPLYLVHWLSECLS